MIANISPSLLSKFYSCPKAFYYESKEERGIKVDDTAVMFGKIAHNIIATFYQKLSSNRTEEEAITEAVEENTVTLTGVRKKLDRVVENFLNFHQKYGKPDFIEKLFTAKLFNDLPEFRGIVDAYYIDMAVIVDWKTGLEDIIDGNHSIQSKIYKLLMERCGFEVKKVLLVYLDEGKVINAPEVTEGYVYKKAKDMLSMIESNYYPKKVGGLCKYCPYKLACSIDKPFWWWI